MASEAGQRGGKAGRGAPGWLAPAGLLLLALALRLAYAAGLPLNWDETRHLELARRITPYGERAYLPATSPLTNHPLGVAYVTALADWAGGGRLFFVRSVFVALHVIGLAGFYRLGVVLLGRSGGLLALGLAAVDRHLTAVAPVMLESPAVSCLAPWALLAVHRGVTRGRPGDWLAAGVVLGVGYWISSVFLAMGAAYAFAVLVSGRCRQLLRSPWPYVAAAAALAVAAPPLLADRAADWANWDRNVAKVGELGLSPRFALLYAGDLLLLLKPAWWIVFYVGDQMYSPVYVPCHWMAGLMYAVLAAASLAFWRRPAVRLAWAAIVAFLIPVTLLDGREPWNEFTWAGSTVYAAILLAALVLVRAGSRWGRGAGWAAFAVSAGLTLWFLTGPKWGYFCPEPERALAGRVLALGYQPPENLSAEELEDLFARIRAVTGRAVRRWPNLAMAWYFHGVYAPTEALRREALRRSLRLAPDNPPARLALARDLIAARRWDEAAEALRRLAADRPDHAETWGLLADVAFEQGEYQAAAEAAERGLALRPGDPQLWRRLALALSMLGDRRRAERALQASIRTDPRGPAGGCLEAALELWRRGRREACLQMVRAAAAFEPNTPREQALIGDLFSRLDQPELADRHLRQAVSLGARDWRTYARLAELARARGDAAAAAAYYERAIAVAPEPGPLHAALGELLKAMGRAEEAERHRRAAEEAGYHPGRKPLD